MTPAPGFAVTGLVHLGRRCYRRWRHALWLRSGVSLGFPAPLEMGHRSSTEKPSAGGWDEHAAARSVPDVDFVAGEPDEPEEPGGAALDVDSLEALDRHVLTSASTGTRLDLTALDRELARKPGARPYSGRQR